MSNRKQRRKAARKNRARKTETRVTIDSQVSEHATVMIRQAPWTKFRHIGDSVPGPGNERLGSRWENSRYIVSMYAPDDDDRMPDAWPGVVHLSFRHVTNVAITDFRDFQRIKSELVHPEAMAVQIFPAESQLVDMANQYHLWVFVPRSWPEVPEDLDWSSLWLPVGFRGERMVTESQPTPGSHQRRFEADQRPTYEEEEVVRSVVRENFRDGPQPEE